MLTPGQKIKAMLAEFDSDSESDSGKPKQKPAKSIFNTNDTQRQEPSADSDGDDGSDEDDDDIVMPKGRMAARMQAQAEKDTSEEPNQKETAYDRVLKTMRAGKEESRKSGNDAGEDDAASSEEEDLPKAGPRRRLNASKKTAQEDDASDRSASRERSFSPMFMSSPTAQRTEDRDQSEEDESDDEAPQPKDKARLRALVAQKRKEREEKEKIEAEKKAAKAAQREQFSSEVLSGEDSEDDGASGHKLTQESRPARKASKKALEEMNRETQRMSRNMQLAHQAQTKKKITKESFFARFNFMQPEEQSAPAPPAENSSATAGSQNSSDAEAQKSKETPRTSPVLGPSDKPSDHDPTKAQPAASTEKEAVDEEMTDLPSLEGVLAGSAPPEPKAAPPQPESKVTRPEKTKPERKALTKPPVRVLMSRQSVAQHQKDDSGSDDDLEVVTSPGKCRRIAAFENLPAKKAQESSAMLKLKALAHIGSPTRRTAGMTPAELSATLLHQARQQANKERSERIAELRAKGIIIETAEERAAMEDEVENLVEKARKEAEDIAKQERKDAKKNGEDVDDEEDDDYELSGSEDEGAYGEDEDEEEEEVHAAAKEEGNDLVDSEAGEDEGEDENEEEEDDRTEVMSEAGVPSSRRKRPTRVISDDEDDEEEIQAPRTPSKPIAQPVNNVERPQIPGLEGDGMTMGLTQAFAGTLGASQDGSQPEPSTIPLSLPDPGAPNFQESDSQMIVKDSQEQRNATPDLFAGYAHSESRVSESPAMRAMSQFSQPPEPTQDAGFVFSPFDPSKRFMGTPHSTIETVVVGDQSQNESPIAHRKGKLLRRGRAAEASEEKEEGDFEIEASAFDVMKKKAKKPSTPFDRKKSKAKDVVEDAAEESEDEYAGLGGASDDSEDEEDAYDQQMINDNSGEKVDEKQLAALNAVHDRNTDEKQVAKLLKDITTGALRRRKNADDDFDLDDSDDELLARRRQKQRENARMRKALLADEKVGEIAENPKKAAFFRAIEDRDMDDDVGLDFLDYEKEGASQEEPSQSSEGQQNSATDESNKRKRPLEPSAEDIANRPPPHLRRKPASAMSKKPASLAEIRETLSFLTERPEYDSFHEDASMDDAPEQEEHEDDEDRERSETPDDKRETSQSKEEFTIPSHPRRTKGHVVDRLALLRQASSNSATSSSANSRFAFQVGSGNDASDIGFRPPLLRKTTTSSSSSSTSKSSAQRNPKAPPSGGSMAKKGAVNYYTAAREKEREREIRSKGRSGSNVAALLNKHAGNRLGALGGKGQWD
ncbi:hypothetical protein ASPWEDRAFT_113502 [Aspergillus wentii DTO 134E9]|uniref:DNA replication checkpoint mediator MRC1 domain-containing protein n=1 Tax=Aspergillus wentii DTO 134E9 TaxID=1073089 RepID=A0A1L9RFX6_ASPWE|nr:uncharacterized protein ASPWEDRAFT_113502 [Aspergillus wentii DTO 134E9]KAI9925580.1 hypothetical protein MW887_005962 [Aspergillus wentii]OJJ33821.1 hypothetical protein ASPWEDRAFT_113502 [Aspergillus wentii DTO 134E9]